jgi:hypothetical protein
MTTPPYQMNFSSGQGTTPSYQMNFSSGKITTPPDQMNFSGDWRVASQQEGSCRADQSDVEVGGAGEGAPPARCDGYVKPGGN